MKAKFCGTLEPAKSAAQVRCIFGLAKQRGIDGDELHQLVEEATRAGERPGKTSIKLLTGPEADRVIERLGGQPLQARRTVQYQRRRAGVVQIVSAAQLELLKDLARQRNWSDDTLAEFSRRQCGHYPPRTTAEANKVIEPLKSMIKRDAA